MSEKLNRIDIRHALILGQDAARQGKSESDCHYTDDDPLKAYWMQGYHTKIIELEYNNVPEKSTVV